MDGSRLSRPVRLWRGRSRVERRRTSRDTRALQLAVKRWVDVLASSVLLVLFAPVLLVVALLVWARLGRPVLFVQERPGLDARIFHLYKFRTMLDARGRDGALRPDAERLTKFGRFLRKTSLDELPQLYNVLRGDMSLVGPRPLLVQYLSLYSPAQLRRHGMRPGITGWAQVHGRNELSWERKFELDLWYIDNWTLWLDVQILMRTLVRVLRGAGVAQSGHATVEYFTGQPPPHTQQ